MRRPRWTVIFVVLVGLALGVAIAGVPSREKDPPLRIQTAPTPTTVVPGEGLPTLPTVPPATATTVRNRTTTTDGSKDES